MADSDAKVGIEKEVVSERASTDEGFLVDLDSLVGMEYVNNDVERRRQLAAARSRRKRARDRHAREQKALDEDDPILSLSGQRMIASSVLTMSFDHQMAELHDQMKTALQYRVQKRKCLDIEIATLKKNVQDLETAYPSLQDAED